MSGRYRAGIIGCGSIAKAHARGYLGASDIELVAVADSHPGALNEFAEKYGVGERYAGYEEMLDRANLDIVSVCLWHGLHAPVTIAAAERGLSGIICEKPMATNLADADAMIEAARRSGSKLVIGHQRRFLASWNAARDHVQNGDIGEPLMLWGRIRDGLLNWGTHVIDGMRYVLDHPATAWVIGQVERHTDRYERGTRIEDRCVGLWSWENGVRGALEADMELNPQKRDPAVTAGGFLVFGTEGMIDVKERHYVIGGRTGPANRVEPEPVEPHVAQAEEMVAWLRDERLHRCRAELARPTMELLMGIYQSVRQQGRVEMPVTAPDLPLDDLVESGSLPVEREGAYDIREFLVRKD